MLDRQAADSDDVTGIDIKAPVTCAARIESHAAGRSAVADDTDIPADDDVIFVISSSADIDGQATGIANSRGDG